MNRQRLQPCSAFEGISRIASGTLEEVVCNLKEKIDISGQTSILIFDDETCETIEVDFRGTVEDVLKRLSKDETQPESNMVEEAAPPSPRGPGRPRIGVVSREITLLPRHWEWLNSQPGGASVTLRRLVEEARRANQERDTVRLAREATYRFMSVMGGNLPGYEEGLRALYAGDRDRMATLIDSWPPDIRAHVLKISDRAFHQGS